MPKITIDADKIKSAGEELKAIAKDYNIIISELYTRINDMAKDGTWASDADRGAANQFINAVVRDKENMQSLANSLNQLGSKMISFASSVNSVADNKL